MYSVDTALQGYPEWYRVEKETEKTIKKLSTVKELGFYLKNPDEYIRRLAILRINELRPKDAIEVLKEIMDDPLESYGNKDLAAWTIKTISLKWNIDLFISGRLLSKFTGNEKYRDICSISVTEPLPSIKFDFASSQIHSDLQLENDDIRHNQDTDFNIAFSLKEWLRAWSTEFAKDAGKIFLSLPLLLLGLMKRFFVFIFKNIFLGLFRWTYQWVKGLRASHQSKARVREKYSTRYGYPAEKRINPLSLAKGLVYNLFYFIFAPIRLLLRHKRFSLATLAVFYCFLTFTTYGQVITYRYFGIDLMEVQSGVYNATKQILGYSIEEAKVILGIRDAPGIDVTQMDGIIEEKTVMQSEPEKKYRVIAKTGLNLREAPAASAAKVTAEMLPYRSVVTYLSKAQKDASGSLWYFVRTSDAKTGWMSARWLEEIGGEQDAGK